MESKDNTESKPEKNENKENIEKKEEDDKTKSKLDKKEEEKKSENKKESHKLDKIKLPKRKFAIIHGYFGQDYSGNTKNPGVRTVEEELENALYKEKFISECNYGKF